MRDPIPESFPKNGYCDTRKRPEFTRGYSCGNLIGKRPYIGVKVLPLRYDKVCDILRAVFRGVRIQELKKRVIHQLGSSLLKFIIKPNDFISAHALKD